MTAQPAPEPTIAVRWEMDPEQAGDLADILGLFEDFLRQASCDAVDELARLPITPPPPPPPPGPPGPRPLPLGRLARRLSRRPGQRTARGHPRRHRCDLDRRPPMTILDPACAP